MPIIGKKLEEFKVHAYHNDEFIEVTNEDFMGKWNLLAFYPADFTFVCPTELESLQDNYETFKSLGVEVYSCSVDSHFVHKAWHDQSHAISKIEYVMLADPLRVLSRQLDVCDEETGLAQRATFLIDPDGVIQAVEINADGIGRNGADFINKVKAAQYVRNNPGQVCPAKWRENGETLAPGLDLVGKI